MKIKYISSIILFFSFLTGICQELILTSSNNNAEKICENERVVLRIINPQQYTDFVWTKTSFETGGPVFDTLEHSLDSLVLENERSAFYIYTVNALLNGVQKTSNDKYMLINPARPYNLLIGGIPALERETICTTQSVRIEYDQGQLTGKTFRWNTGETTSSLDIDRNGLYELQVFDPAYPACPLYDQVEVKTLIPTVTVIEPIKSLCKGTEIIIQPDVLPYDPFTNLVYNWDNGTANSLNLTVSSAGRHKLITSYQSTQRGTCKDSVYFDIIEKENPHIDAIGEINTSEIPHNIDITDYIQSSEKYSYEWINNEQQIISQATTVTLTKEGDYNVKITDKTTNCSFSTSLKLVLVPIIIPPVIPPLTPPVVQPEEEVEEVKESFFVPTVFSPNESNENNNSLRIYGEFISNENFIYEVYNKWGEIVFTTDDIDFAKNIGWTGKKNNSGDVLQSGVYTYKVKGQFTNGSPFNKIGSSTLLR